MRGTVFVNIYDYFQPLVSVVAAIDCWRVGSPMLIDILRSGRSESVSLATSLTHNSTSVSGFAG